MPNTTTIRFLFILSLSLFLGSCAAQMKSTMGEVKGKVDIGPICPQEPCNPTPEKLRQVYASYEIVITDSTGEKTLYRIPIESNGSFRTEIAAGHYLASIKPISGGAFHVMPSTVNIRPRRTTSIHLEYDTGLR